MVSIASAEDSMKGKADIVEEAQILLKILSIERADDYHDWIKVGVCLHNISKNLLPSWIEFSRKSEKFKEGECADYWKKMRQGKYTIGISSLHRWAKEDNQVKYEEIILRSKLNDVVRKSLSRRLHYQVTAD